MINRFYSIVVLLLLAACDRVSETSPADMVIYKSPTCGCCRLWVQHVKQAGLSVEVHDTEDTASIKTQLGVPQSTRSCHTARIGGYFIEGHVPVADIKRLLAQRPDAKGLVVPGMPSGSPGMESPSGKVTPYEVLLVGNDGSSTVFARHGR